MDYEIVLILRSIVGELGIVLANYVDAQKSERRERIASEQLAALVSGTGLENSEAIFPDDFVAGALCLADALIASLDAKAEGSGNDAL